MSLTFGRFDNPFWSPTDLVWDSDLGFDGLAINAKREVSPRLRMVAQAIRMGTSLEEVHAISKIDPWFLEQIGGIIAMEARIREHGLPAMRGSMFSRPRASRRSVSK